MLLGSGSPVTVSDLQRAYDAWDGVDPAIQLSAVNAGITVRDTAAGLGTLLWAIQDNAGTTDFLSVLASTVNIQSPSTTSTGPGEVQVRVNAGANTVEFWPSSRTFTSSPGALMRTIAGNIHIHDYPSVSFAALNLQSTMQHDQAGFPFNHGLIFNHGLQYRNTSGVAVNYGPIQGFIDQPNIAADGAALTQLFTRSFLSQPNFNTIGGGSLAQTVGFANFQAFGQLNTGVTMPTRRGLEVGDMGGVGGTLTTQIGVDIAALSRGTTNIALRTASSAGNAWLHTGTAVSELAGDLHMNNGISLVLGSVGANRVELLRSAAGVMRMIGVGGTNNEGLDWDFDTPTANNIEVTSSTGAALQLNLAEISLGTTAASGAADNFFIAIANPAKTITLAGDFANVLNSTGASHTINAALSQFAQWIVNAPAGTIGTGSVVDAANMIIQTSVSVGTNRYGLLITANPSGGTINNALRVVNGIARFDQTVDFRTSDALGGGAAATLGTIGGTGPTAAAQAIWLRVLVAGVTHWLAAWT